MLCTHTYVQLKGRGMHACRQAGEHACAWSTRRLALGKLPRSINRRSFHRGNERLSRHLPAEEVFHSIPHDRCILPGWW